MSVGNAVGAVVGAVIGFYIGGPAGALKGAQLGMTVGGIVDPPKGPSVNGPRLTDLTLQSSSYNSVIPRVYGTVALTGNIIWLENNQLKEVVSTSKSGGKGGGGGSEVTTYSYYATFAVALCKGPIIGVKRIWIGPNLVYDAGTSNHNAIVASNEVASIFTLHRGTDTQLPDERMQATLGVANTPAYRGLSYIVFKDLSLAKYNNSLVGAQIKVEVVVTGTEMNYVTETFVNCGMSMGRVEWNGSYFCGIYYSGGGSYGSGISVDGLNWTFSSSLPHASQYEGLCWNGKFWLAVNVGGGAYKSYNGLDWQFAGNVGFVNVASMAWNGEVFCAVGGVYYSSSSKDGSAWVGSNLHVVQAWTKIIPAGKNFLAVGGFGKSTALSKDNGLTWINGLFPVSSIWEGVAWNGSIFCALTGTYNVTSPDGLVWTDHGPVANVQSYTLFWEKGLFINCGGYYNLTSPDGINWTTYVGGKTAPNTINTVCSNGSIYLITTQSAMISRVIPGQVNSISPTLSSIISNEIILTDLLSPSDIDTSLLTQPIRGYRVGRITSLKTALEPLQAAYPFDIIQSGYKIKFKPRGSTSVVTIPVSDLGSTQGE